MSVCRLPLATSPITAFLIYSSNLSVTLSKGIEAQGWFNSNFIQLQCYNDQLVPGERMAEVHFTEGSWIYNPWLASSAQFEKSHIPSGTFPAYVQDQLASGIYVETFVDEYYLSSLWFGGVKVFPHRLLISGFDSKNETFWVSGFDKFLKYSQIEIRSDELSLAFEKCDFPPWGKIRLFNLKANNLPVAFDRERTRKSLVDYLEGRNTFMDPDLKGDRSDYSSVAYGVNVYDFLGRYLEHAASTGVVRPDNRGFQALWEHKKCMRQRLTWLKSAGVEISDEMSIEYAVVVNAIDAVRMKMTLALTRRMGVENTSVPSIKNLLDRAKAVEEKVLSKVYAALA